MLFGFKHRSTRTLAEFQWSSQLARNHWEGPSPLSLHQRMTWDLNDAFVLKLKKPLWLPDPICTSNVGERHRQRVDHFHDKMWTYRAISAALKMHFKPTKHQQRPFLGSLKRWRLGNRSLVWRESWTRGHVEGDVGIYALFQLPTRRCSNITTKQQRMTFSLLIFPSNNCPRSKQILAPL